MTAKEEDPFEVPFLGYLAARHAQHLSRAQVAGVLLARKTGHAYTGQQGPGAPAVTNRTLATLVGLKVLAPGALSLTDHGQRVAIILIAEVRRYL